MGCNCGKPKCDGNCGVSPAVLQVNNNECTLFRKVEVPASMGDETVNPPEAGEYRNVLLYYEASGNSYLYSSDGMPTKLTGVVNDYEVLLNKPWINGVELIGHKTLADLGITSAINIAVGNEATLRQNADTTLQNNINAEANTRSNADTALQNNINAEANTRSGADITLQNNITAEQNARINADTALQNNINTLTTSQNSLVSQVNANTSGLSSEITNRTNADTVLQNQITALTNSAITADDINYTVTTGSSTSSNSSTASITDSKVNLKTGNASSTTYALPVASSTKAGVMNSATYAAVTSNTNNINAILNGAVAITGLSSSPTQVELTTAWQTETGLSTLINRASIYDVTNAKVWTYYTNDTTWYATTSASTITINTFTNNSEGTIKGSTTDGQVYAESDGTGSVNGWDTLTNDVSTLQSQVAGITVNNATLTIQKNGANVQTFTANSSTNKTANITVPTKTSDLENDSDFVSATDNPQCEQGVFISTINPNGSPAPLSSVELLGNTTQDGTPTPDAPVAVQTTTGENVAKITGKNLCGYAPKSSAQQGLSSTYDATTGIVHITGTATQTYSNISASLPQHIEAGTYAWRSRLVAGSFNGNINLRTEASDSSAVDTVYAGIGTTHIETLSEAEQCRMYIGGAVIGTTYDFSVKFQLEKGSQATDFEPYQSQSYEVNLGSIELCKLGTYQDKIYKSGDDWFVHREVGKYTFTGDESPSVSATSTNTTRCLINNCLPADEQSQPEATATGASNYFEYRLNWSEDAEGIYSNNRAIVFRGAKTTIGTTQANVKTWLASTTPTYYYALATATDTQITNQALIDQLDALASSTLFVGENNIALVPSSGAQGELSLCFYQSTLPVATDKRLGAVIVGDGLNISSTGVISTDPYYTKTESDAAFVPQTRTVNSKPLSSNVTLTASDVGALPDSTVIPTVNNATLTIQKNGTTVNTFTANASSNVTANITVPTKTSDLNNDSGFIASSSLATVATSGSYADLSNKPTIPVITLTTTDPGEGSALAANNFIGVYQ